VHAEVEATRRNGVRAIGQVRVAVVPLARTGTPREEVVCVARVYGIDNDVDGHRQRIS
jgi:hypothetical protein